MAETPDGVLETGGDEPTAIAVREPTPTQLAQWTPRFAISLKEAVEMVESKRQFFKDVMKAEMHFGVIPGTDKPSLLKPGAELLLSSMGLHPETFNEEDPVIDLTGKAHDGEPFVAFSRKCFIYRQTGPEYGDRILIAAAGGYCSSWESKYRYREQKRKCPSCGLATIIKGKQFDQKKAAAGIAGDWVCWKKGGGCGSSFPPSSPDGRKIEAQAVGRIPNPDVADLVNTIKKMADKRAVVAATLLATGCSDIFTQDAEDQGDGEPPRNGAPAAPAKAPADAKGKGKGKAPAAQPAAPPAEPAQPTERHALKVQELMDLARSIASQYGHVVDLASTIAAFERTAKPGDPFHGFSGRNPKALTPTERIHLEDHLLDIKDGLDLEAKGRAAHEAAEDPQDDEEVLF